MRHRPHPTITRRQNSSEKRPPKTLLEVTKITLVHGKQRAASCKALVATGQSRMTMQVVHSSRCPGNHHTACAPLARPCVPVQGCVHFEERCLVLLCTKALYELAAETPRQSQKQPSILLTAPPPQEANKREPVCASAHSDHLNHA